MNLDWNQLSVLITGGTGSFGKSFAELLLKRHRPKRLIIFSRDELKQSEMREQFPESPESPIRYFIGDVRDRDRLHRAFKGVDVVVHAAALKQVSTGEYNPLEVIKTNILGAANVIDAAIDCAVQKVVALSTDKAVSPINLYGATKLCADKLFAAAGVYAGGQSTRFSVVRYGNVIGSRGSVIPRFREQRATGTVSLTDSRMTRFWITLDQATALVVRSLEMMRGGEIFVPKIPSMRLVDLADAVAPGCRQDFVGLRPGEKIHEVLLTEDECRRSLEFDTFYSVCANHDASRVREEASQGKPVPEGFCYSSDTNDRWLSIEDLRGIADAA